MWSLRQRKDGSFFLTYDRERRFTHNLRGTWEFVGPQGNTYTAKCVRTNSQRGLLCCNDDEGNVRVLVLED
jgi:hypothetical protein